MRLTAATGFALLLASGCSSCRGHAKPVTKWTTSTERFTAKAMTLYHLRADGQALYWISCASLGEPCSLLRLAHDSATPTVLLARPWMHALAVDDTSAYVAAGDEVLRVAKTGGPPTVLSEGPPAADVQVAGGFAYLAVADTRDLEGPSASPHEGSIVRVPVSGGAPVVLGKHSGHIPQMVLDDRRIYFTSDQALESMPIGGGSLTELAKDEHHGIMSPAIDGDSVYFAAGGEVRRVPKGGGSVTVLYRATIVQNVRAAGNLVYAARNGAIDRGTVVETGAIVRIDPSRGSADVVADLRDGPGSLAVDRTGVFVVLTGGGSGASAGTDTIVAYPAGQ